MKFSVATIVLFGSTAALAASAVDETVSVVSDVVASANPALDNHWVGGTTEKFDEKLRVSRPADITEEEVRALFYLWNDALLTGDSRIVAKRYSSDPMLLPTVSDEPRTDFAGVKDYFDKFLAKKPRGEILEGKIKIGHNWAKDAGLYQFTLGDGSVVKARYSFIYVYENGQWKISHHHSSTMPEGKANIEEHQVRNLFHLWNDALETLDADLVARRYAKKATLLPTVSDTPRTDYESIKDYFVNFLKLQPHGKILESHVTIGDSWAKDVGLYSFYLGATGETVKARYSFVYIREDGEWRIQHHHSSTMPESKIGKDITEEEVRSLFDLWNEALKTQDADAVAMRYTNNAVLLPSVSDIPRAGYDSIKDYFDSFLLKKPQAEPLESYVLIGDNFCQNVGLYEFTMSATGEKIKGRFSFVYVFDSGEWKILHHHSSFMPVSVHGSGAGMTLPGTWREEQFQQPDVTPQKVTAPSEVLNEAPQPVKGIEVGRDAAMQAEE